MSAQSGQQSYFSIFFCRQTEKQKTSRISWMRVSYPNADDLTEHCFKEIWEGVLI